MTTTTRLAALDPLVNVANAVLSGGAALGFEVSPEDFVDSSGEATAACEGVGVAMFFSEHFDDIAAAKTLCLQGPIRDRCLDEAVARGEQYGVWGGQLFEAGRIVIAKRRRGRPAKVPRPGDSLPEVAVPAAYQSLVVCA